MANKLLALAKKNPAAFLLGYATVLAKASAEKYIAENDVSEADAAELREEPFDDYDGKYLSFLDDECMDHIVEGITLKQVYALGGGEGGGEHVERVWAVMTGCTPKKPTADQVKWGTNPGTEGGEAVLHLRATGYYASYNGTDYNDEIELVERYAVRDVRYGSKNEIKIAKKDGTLIE